MRSFLLLLLSTLAIRGAVIWVQQSELNSDPDGYRAIAERVAQEGTFGRTIQGETQPTAFRPPLYPLALATIGSTNLSVAVFHLLLGLATVALTYLIARDIFETKFALVAAALVTIDPILLQQSALVMTETLATFLATASLFLLNQWSNEKGPNRRQSALLGLILGLSVLCRPTFLLFALGVVLVLAWKRRTGKNDESAHSGKPLLVVALGVVLVCLPWMIRNQLQFGRPMITTTHGGYTVWLGNNPGFYEYLRSGRWTKEVWDSKLLDEQSLAILKKHNFDELASDREHYQRAWTDISVEPGMFVFSCFVRAQRLWGCFPYQLHQYGSTARRAMLTLVGVWYVALLLVAFVGVVRIRRGWLTAPWLWGLLLCLVMTAVHSVYWSNLRMRAPLMPFVALLAVAGVVGLGRGGNEHRGTEGTESHRA